MFKPESNLKSENKQEKQESIESKKLVEVLQAKKFLERISAAADITFHSDHEAGFATIFNRSFRKLFWGKVVGAEETNARQDRLVSLGESGSAMVDLTEISLKRAGYDEFQMELQTNEIYIYLTFHMHPGYHLEPSPEDLQSLITERADFSKRGDVTEAVMLTSVEYANNFFRKNFIPEYPILAIAALTDQNELQMILVREKFNNKQRDAQIGEFVFDKMLMHPDFSLADTEKKVKLLNQSGVFKAAFLELSRPDEKQSFAPKIATLEETIKKFCDND